MDEWLVIKILAGGLFYAVVVALATLSRWRSVSRQLHEAKEECHRLKLAAQNCEGQAVRSSYYTDMYKELCVSQEATISVLQGKLAQKEKESMAKIIATPTIQSIQGTIVGPYTNLEEAKNMLAAAQACQKAGLPIPENVTKYFGGKIPEAIYANKVVDAIFVANSEKYVNGIKTYEFDFTLPSGEKLRVKMAYIAQLQTTGNE